MDTLAGLLQRVQAALRASERDACRVRREALQALRAEVQERIEVEEACARVYEERFARPRTHTAAARPLPENVIPIGAVVAALHVARPLPPQSAPDHERGIQGTPAVPAWKECPACQGYGVDDRIEPSSHDPDTWDTPDGEPPPCPQCKGRGGWVPGCPECVPLPEPPRCLNCGAALVTLSEDDSIPPVAPPMPRACPTCEPRMVRRWGNWIAPPAPGYGGAS